MDVGSVVKFLSKLATERRICHVEQTSFSQTR